MPGLTDVHPAALEFIPQADVQVNLAAARRYGLTPGVIRRAAAIMMASEPMSEISSGGVLTTVAAWSTPATRQNLASLRQLQGQGQNQTQNGAPVLNREQQAQIEKFRTDLVQTRGSLRQVQANLREDVERLGTLIAVLNIALVPILIALAAIVISFLRRRRRARARALA